MDYSLGKMDPNWVKCLKNGQNFSRSGQKKNSFQQVSESRVSNVVANLCMEGRLERLDLESGIHVYLAVLLL